MAAGPYQHPRDPARHHQTPGTIITPSDGRRLSSNAVTEINIQTASDHGLTRAFKHNGATASIACLRPTRRLIAASDQQPNRNIINNHAISHGDSRYSKPSATTAITNSSRAYHAKTPHPYSNLKSRTRQVHILGMTAHPIYPHHANATRPPRHWHNSPHPRPKPHPQQRSTSPTTSFITDRPPTGSPPSTRSAHDRTRQPQNHNSNPKNLSSGPTGPDRDPITA
jgi:hypothetical protein